MGRQRNEGILPKPRFNVAFFLGLSALAVGIINLLPSSAASALSLNLKLPVLDTTIDISQSQSTSSTTHGTASLDRMTSTTNGQTTGNENISSANADTSSAAGERFLPDPAKITPLSPLPFIDTTINDNRMAQMKLEPTLASAEEDRQASAPPAGILESTSRGWRIFGIFWYWWAIGIAGLAATGYGALRMTKRLSANAVVS